MPKGHRKQAVKPGNPKVAVAYVRVSKEEQQLGPKAQEDAIRLWAAREGVHVARQCTDQGLSGGLPIGERPGLTEAIAALRELNAGVLVAAKRDRLAREATEAGLLGRAVAAAGAVIRTPDGAGDQKGPEGELMVQIFDAFAQYERGAIRYRTRSALAVKKSKGERIGQIPYGWRLGTDKIHLEEEPDEQKTVIRALELDAQGVDQRSIARILTEEGSRSRAGTPFLQPQIHRMLVRAKAARQE